jgi:hypothetical protein
MKKTAALLKEVMTNSESEYSDITKVDLPTLNDVAALERNLMQQLQEFGIGVDELDDERLENHAAQAHEYEDVIPRIETDDISAQAFYPVGSTSSSTTVTATAVPFSVTTQLTAGGMITAEASSLGNEVEASGDEDRSEAVVIPRSYRLSPLQMAFSLWVSSHRSSCF